MLVLVEYQYRGIVLALVDVLQCLEFLVVDLNYLAVAILVMVVGIYRAVGIL